MYYLKVLENISPKSRCWQACAPSGGSSGASILCLPASVVTGFPWHSLAIPLQAPPLWSYCLLFLCVLGHNILNSIISARSPLPNKVTFKSLFQGFELEYVFLGGHHSIHYTIHQKARDCE